MTLDTPLRAAPPISRLTPGQRECLLLVAQLQSSKKIARTLGISPYTVDQRVARACRTLGTATRVEAALMVAEDEARGGVTAISDAVALDQTPPPKPAFPQFDTGPGSAAPEPHVTRTPSDPNVMERRSNVPFPTRAQRSNDMSFQRRLAWAMAIAVAAVVTVGMLLTSLVALQSLT